MPRDGVEDVEGVSDGADMDTGEGGLLKHWKEGSGRGERVVGEGGRITDRRCF